MGNFDSSFFRALAVGPRHSSPRRSDPARDWSSPDQVRLYEESARLLYKVLMLRAADIMETTGQDDPRIPDEMRQVEVHLAIRFLSKAADRPANGALAKQHSTPPFRALTDNHGIHVAVMRDGVSNVQEDAALQHAITEFITAGLACPPPR